MCLLDYKTKRITRAATVNEIPAETDVLDPLRATNHLSNGFK